MFFNFYGSVVMALSFTDHLRTFERENFELWKALFFYKIVSTFLCFIEIFEKICWISIDRNLIKLGVVEKESLSQLCLIKRWLVWLSWKLIQHILNLITRLFFSLLVRGREMSTRGYINHQRMKIVFRMTSERVFMVRLSSYKVSSSHHRPFVVSISFNQDS